MIYLMRTTMISTIWSKIVLSIKVLQLPVEQQKEVVDLLRSIKQKFSSGNDVPVERIAIQRREIETVLPIIEGLLK